MAQLFELFSGFGAYPFLAASMADHGRDVAKIDAGSRPQDSHFDPFRAADRKANGVDLPPSPSRTPRVCQANQERDSGIPCERDPVCIFN